MSEEIKAGPLEKAVARAFDYFPFGFDKVHYFHEWACGPTFMALVPEEFVALSILASDSIYKQDALWKEKAQGLLEGAEHAKTTIDVNGSGHPMERIEVKDKDGAMVPSGPSKCTGRAVLEGGKPFAELPFPLFGLGRSLKVDSYRHEALGSPIYGFRKGQLVVMLAPRLLDAQCRP